MARKSKINITDEQIAEKLNQTETPMTTHDLLVEFGYTNKHAWELRLRTFFRKRGEAQMKKDPSKRLFTMKEHVKGRTKYVFESAQTKKNGDKPGLAN